MQKIRYPGRDEWAALVRPLQEEAVAVDAAVGDILAQVRTSGDAALIDLALRYDKATLNTLAVSEQEFSAARELVTESLQAAIESARLNIDTFHRAQREVPSRIETTPGVVCWRKSVPISPVGLYVPGGSAPLFSTALMLGVPAGIAGCEKIVVCTPPRSDGSIHPALLYTLDLLGLRNVWKVGGAQAVAALAYGTQSIPRVEKIFGPGNRYVTRAKEIVAQSGAVAIDMPAGPSEVAIIADAQSEAVYIAADLLSQAEHGSDSHVLLVATDEALIDRVIDELGRQLEDLPRQELAVQSLRRSVAILSHSLDEAMEIVNCYAPEHLILHVDSPYDLADKVRNAGSVFLGAYSPEAVGDYASGTNHTLPTAGHAARTSGVSLDSFVKKITFQHISAEGLKKIGPVTEILADAEGLEGHRRAVSVRLQSLMPGGTTHV